METKKLKKWIIENCLNAETQEIDLSDLEFLGYTINLSGIKAKKIINTGQRALYISNDKQKVKYWIENSKQYGESIDNDGQVAEMEIDNDNQTSLMDYISNSYQKAVKIYNREQKAHRFINNQFQMTLKQIGVKRLEYVKELKALPSKELEKVLVKKLTEIDRPFNSFVWYNQRIVAMKNKDSYIFRISEINNDDFKEHKINELKQSLIIHMIIDLILDYTK